MSAIFEYILISEKINDCIARIPSKYRDDFKQHFYVQMLEMKEDKVLNAYSNGYLDWLCIRVITNQYNSNTSSFYNLYRDYNKPTTGYIQFEDVNESDIVYVNDNLEKQGEDLNKFKNIEKLLNDRHFYHKQLWYMYYIEEMSYRDIEKQTGINFQSVRSSVLKTNEYIKNNFKEC